MPDTIGSFSRVQTVFNELLDRRPFGDPWLEGLWTMAASTRPAHAAKHPVSLGTLIIEEAPSERPARAGKVFDRPVAPPAAFLRWLLEHPEAMHVRDRETFGAKSDDVRAWRRKLFSSSLEDVGAAKEEGLRQLGSRLAQRGRNKWWLFEGFARIDACFITDECVLLIGQDAPVVEIYERGVDGSWHKRRIDRTDAILSVAAIGEICTITQLYRGTPLQRTK